ncbi:MAG: SIS domain-containing protein [Chloroflexi bacterium]|nr:SIS domain-containing protein [Chloroflexota bacterium]
MDHHVTEEIASQPDLWARAADIARSSDVLPRPGERVAVIGCGTSWFMAMCYAVLRESAGAGWTDAFAASEMPRDRAYDRVIAVSRSGTTTEILEALAPLRGRVPTVAITGDPATPIADASDDLLVLEAADERSVVQTRFATTVLALLRASLGEDIAPVVEDAHAALEIPVEPYLGAEQVSFLGTGWTVGLAHEAALKMREAAQAWTEAYASGEYRHGPVSIAQPGRLTWLFGEAPADLPDVVAATGADFVHHAHLDPLAALIVAQRMAVALALRRGLDPDQPRHLTRSVILAR